MNEIAPRPTKEISPWHIQRLNEPEAVEYTYGSDAESRHLCDYWNVVVKHRRLVLLVFFVVFVVTAYINFSATPLYTASAQLQIEPQNPAVTGLAEILSSKSEGSAQYDYYQTQFILLRSRALAARVITNLNLAAEPAFNTRTISENVINRILPWVSGIFQPLITYGSRLFESSTTQKKFGAPDKTDTTPKVSPFLVGRYLSYFKVVPVKNTRLVEVFFSTPDPRLSQKLADAHAAGFIRMNLDNRSTLTDEARDFLDKKNAELKAKLEQSEEALNRFRQENNVVSLDKGENIVVDRMVALNGQLTTARAQRLDAEALYRTVANKKYQDLSQVMTQGSIPLLKNNIATLEAEKARLSTIFKADHPRIQDLTEQIAAARRSLNTEIQNVVRGIESNYVAARAREEALETEAKKQEELALNLKHVGVQYAVLQEEVNVNRNLYESVLKRLSETNVSNDLAISNIQITQRADLPLFPSSPNTPLNLLVGTVVGLFLGIGTAFLLDYLDTRISTPEHVQRAVSLNTLGVVPDLNMLDKFPVGWHQGGRSLLQSLKDLRPVNRSAQVAAPQEMLLTKHHPLSVFPESYRSIRTSLLFSRAEKPPQVILLTSASPGEGKTGTSLNIAIALAQDGHSVLIVDADLRKGCCHERLGMSNQKGLSNILTGNLRLADGIQATPIHGLSLITRGLCPPNPADLLGSNKMREILASLRDSFQFIVIDSPPAVAITDAAVLSVLSDGVILVFHGRKTTTVAARQLIERMDAVHAPVLGVVLNSVDLENPHFAYYGSYRSYYSDGNKIDESNNCEAADTIIEQFDLSKKAGQFPWANEKQETIDSAENCAKTEDLKQKPSQHAANATAKLNGAQQPVDVEGPALGKETSSEPKAGGNLASQESLNRLIAAVTKSLGPVAPQVVREQIANLGESFTAFPIVRIGELVKLLQREITQRTNGSEIPESARGSKA